MTPQDGMQVAGLQIVVDQEAIAKAMPLRPGTRMALPLLLHAPQVRANAPLWGSALALQTVRSSSACVKC